ncbi:MAG: nitroreductase family protein [Limnochordales bacterium]|nr:nitroreductase family protein [Limnochordales bacterium]
MDVFEAIMQRRSVRQYKPDEVSVSDIKKVLEAANWAPSARNTQPWHFIVARGAKKDEFARLYGQIVERGMPPAGQRTPDQERRVEWARTLGKAPVLIVALTRRGNDAAGTKASLESTCAALENLMLAATALGLGTCWMTGPLAEEAKLREIFSIGPEWEVVATTPLGYPDGLPNPPARQDPELKQKVTWIGFSS